MASNSFYEPTNPEQVEVTTESLATDMAKGLVRGTAVEVARCLCVLRMGRRCFDLGCPCRYQQWEQLRKQSRAASRASQELRQYGVCCALEDPLCSACRPKPLDGGPRCWSRGFQLHEKQMKPPASADAKRTSRDAQRKPPSKKTVASPAAAATRMSAIIAPGEIQRRSIIPGSAKKYWQENFQADDAEDERNAASSSLSSQSICGKRKSATSNQLDDGRHKKHVASLR